MLKWLNDR